MFQSHADEFIARGNHDDAIRQAERARLLALIPRRAKARPLPPLRVLAGAMVAFVRLLH